jgi:hypothetical protein
MDIYIQLPDENRCLSRIDKFSKTCERQRKALFACFYKANDIKVTSIYKAYHDKIHMQNSFYAFTITLQTCVWVQPGSL